MTIFYSEPLIWKRRAGDSEDPYISIREVLMIKDGLVLLQEIPDNFQKVSVSGEGISWSEIKEGDIGETNFLVNYTNGLVYFNPIHNGKTLTFNYLGTGFFYIPAGRIATLLDSSNNVVQTLKNIIDTEEDALQAIEDLQEILDNIAEFKHQGTYNIDTNYKTYNIVDDGDGNSYIAVQDSIGQLLTNTNYWKPIATKGGQGIQGEIGIGLEYDWDGTKLGVRREDEDSYTYSDLKGDQGDRGLTWKGEYNDVTPYVKDDVVHYAGSVYIAKQATTGNIPTNKTYWDLFVIKGADGEGTGDMLMATYDANGNNIVDDAEKLGGENPSYYDFREHFGNTEGSVCEGNDPRLNRFIIGGGTFGSTTGTTITHNLGHTNYRVLITPMQDTSGYLGEVYVVKEANSFTVYNTGSCNDKTFDYQLIQQV